MIMNKSIMTVLDTLNFIIFNSNKSKSLLAINVFDKENFFQCHWLTQSFTWGQFLPLVFKLHDFCARRNCLVSWVSLSFTLRHNITDSLISQLVSSSSVWLCSVSLSGRTVRESHAAPMLFLQIWEALGDFLHWALLFVCLGIKNSILLFLYSVHLYLKLYLLLL